MRSWSVSSVRQFHTCQLQWWFKRQGYPEEFRPVALVAGTVLHAVLAYHLRELLAGKAPATEEAEEILVATWFTEECGSAAPIEYGRIDQGQTLDRLRGLYRHWTAGLDQAINIVAIEREIRADLPGIDLPLLGYVDLVVATPDGDLVFDFKVTGSRPYPDHLLAPLDLQKLAMTRGWEAQTGRTASGWRWQNLVKTKEPKVVDVDLAVAPEDRERDLARLSAVVSPTIRHMEAVLDGRLAPVPTQGYAALCCSGCPYRTRCASWKGI